MHTPRPRHALFVALSVVAALAVSTLPASAGGERLVRLIVRTDPGNAPSAAGLQGAGAVSIQSLRFTPNAMVVVARGGSARRLAAVDGVASVEPDRLAHATHHRPGHGSGGDGGSTQPAQQTPWGISKIDATSAWGTSTGSAIDVCVTDTGIDRDHPDVVANIEAGRNFTGGGPNGANVKPDRWQDGNGHGTHVAGTVAATNDAIGVVGVSHQADLLVAKVLDDSGSGWHSWIAEGLNWCRSMGAEVVNMSLGGGGSTLLHDALKDLAAAGAVLVAASGNEGASLPSYPARYPEVIAVGATDSGDGVASWSNDGEEVLAPGVSVLSTVPNDTYTTYSGTSMASPHAAGTAALIIAAGTTSAASVRSILSTTADSVPGGVRIDAYSAVQAA